MGSHLPLGRSDILAFTPTKLALDLATPEGCKAELTKVAGYIPRWYTQLKTWVNLVHATNAANHYATPPTKCLM